MRGYSPDNVIGAMDGCSGSRGRPGVAALISHFNSRADLVLPHSRPGARLGLDVAFDLYGYLARLHHSRDDRAAALGPGGRGRRDAGPAERSRPCGPGSGPRASPAPRGPLDEVRLSYVEAPAYRSADEGLTLGRGRLRRATGRAGADAIVDFVCDVLVASALAVGCVVAHQQRARRAT